MPGRLTPDRLKSALKKSAPEPAYYLYGSEGILKNESLALILDTALDPALRDFNLDYHSANQLVPDALASACSTLPMMAERRVVVLRDIEAWKRKSKAKQPAVVYLEKPAQETVLIMVQGNDDDPDEELSKHCVSVECAPLVGDALESWVDGQLQRAGISLTPQGREHLVRATNGDLGMLESEVQKLAGLDIKGPIDGAMVGSMVGIRIGETGDDWRDLILRDDTGAALKLIPHLLSTSGTTPVSLVSLLGTSLLMLRWARTTAQAKKLRDRALSEQVKHLCFANRPRVGNYNLFAPLLASVVGQWPASRIRAAVAATLEADVALKSTTISDGGGILTDLVLTIAASRVRKVA